MIVVSSKGRWRRAGLDRRRAPRVLHISPITFGADSGFGEDAVFDGGERYAAGLARAMATQTPTTLLTFARAGSDVPAPPPAAPPLPGLTVRILPTRLRYRGEELNPLSEQLVPAIARADVIHLHQWEGVLANVVTVIAAALGKPLFVTDHGAATPNHWRRLHLQRRVAGLLSVSDFAASFYPELATVATTVYGGVDSAWFAPNAAARRGNHAVFVGPLLAHKGIDTLIAALDPHTELRVVGRPWDGAFYRHLQNLAAGKKVSFLTEASEEQVRLEYQQARVAVLPSAVAPSADAETVAETGTETGAPPKSELLGLALIEAMACGTPAICTRVGGLPEVVLNGITGYVVPPRDPRALAARVAELTSPNSDWASMSRASRDRVMDTFTWGRVADRCLRAYRLATRGRASC